MAVYSFKVGPYARQIYIDGRQRFTARDGFTGIPEEYHAPVKDYAAKNFTLSQIDYALLKMWINQSEYDGTVVLITEPVILPQSPAQGGA
jgi:hypothetical protein